MGSIETEIIFISSHGQAALWALDSSKFESEFIWDCFQSLMELGGYNKVQLIWIQEHKGIPASEKADILAKRGSVAPFKDQILS
jgi:ribonuclease HI